MSWTTYTCHKCGEEHDPLERHICDEKEIDNKSNDMDENKTIDDKAKEYTDAVNILGNVGEVQTGYLFGYMQAESDLIRKLFDTKQFTMSKIAEMLDMRIMEVRNAINYTEWK